MKHERDGSQLLAECVERYHLERTWRTRLPDDLRRGSCSVTRTERGTFYTAPTDPERPNPDDHHRGSATFSQVAPPLLVRRTTVVELRPHTIRPSDMFVKIIGETLVQRTSPIGVKSAPPSLIR